MKNKISKLLAIGLSSAVAFSVISANLPKNHNVVFAAQAKTIYVEIDGNENQGGGSGAENSPYQSLKYAISKAEDGDTIKLKNPADGITKAIREDAGVNGLFIIDKNIIIDGGNVSTLQFRGLDVELRKNVIFKDLKIRFNNNGVSLGKIYASGNKVTFDNVNTKEGYQQDAERPVLIAGSKEGNPIGSAAEFVIKNGFSENRFNKVILGNEDRDLNIDASLIVESEFAKVDEGVILGGEGAHKTTGRVQVQSNSKNIEKFVGTNSDNNKVTFTGSTIYGVQLVGVKNLAVLPNTSVSVESDFAGVSGNVEVNGELNLTNSTEQVIVAESISGDGKIVFSTNSTIVTGGDITGNLKFELRGTPQQIQDRLNTNVVEAGGNIDAGVTLKVQGDVVQVKEDTSTISLVNDAAKVNVIVREDSDANGNVDENDDSIIDLFIDYTTNNPVDYIKEVVNDVKLNGKVIINTENNTIYNESTGGTLDFVAFYVAKPGNVDIDGVKTPFTVEVNNERQEVSYTLPAPEAGFHYETADGAKVTDLAKKVLTGDARFTDVVLKKVADATTPRNFVGFEIEPEDPAIDVPQDVKTFMTTNNIIPSDYELVGGAVAQQPQDITVKVNDAANGGKWEFLGWEKEDRTDIHGDKWTIWISIWTLVPDAATEFDAEYKFISATPNKNLPSEITNYVDDLNVADGTNVNAVAPRKNNVVDTVNDGVWVFVDYDTPAKAVDNANVVFTGKYNFVANVHDVEYRFESLVEGKNLPVEITNYTEDVNKVSGDVVTATQPQKDNVVDTINDGVWVFANYDAPSKAVNKANVVFTGKYNFVANVYDAEYKFTSATVGKNLPASIVDYTDDINKAKGTNLIAAAPRLDAVVDTDNDGVWHFDGYDVTNKVMGTENVVFNGKYRFEANKYQVEFVFETENTNESLPNEVKALLPALKNNLLNGANVTIDDLTVKKVQDANLKGSWEFLGWDQTSVTINKANKTVKGLWRLVVSKKGDALKQPALPELKSESKKGDSLIQPILPEAKLTENSALKSDVDTSSTNDMAMVIGMIVSLLGLIALKNRKNIK